MEKLGIELKRIMAREIKEKLQNKDELFFSSFSGLAVDEQERLRRRLKDNKASFMVVKNRIAQKVFSQLQIEELSTFMQQMTAITVSSGDPVSISKILLEFAEKNEKFVVVGAYVGGQTLNRNSVKQLATIPAKEVLLAQIVRGIKSPISGLVNCLSATMRNFVVVLDKIREKKV
ncbi:MAG: 50S ribosomal protein L10 [Candidatus Omnitrophota bacterium]